VGGLLDELNVGGGSLGLLRVECFEERDSFLR